MQLPTIDDINTTRVARFTQSITDALQSDQLGFFRDLVASYEHENDVPATDVAAALAVLVQDDQPLLREPEATPPPIKAFDRDAPKAKRGKESWGEKTPRGTQRKESGPKRQRGSVPLATYTIAVGKRHKVEPRQIVGAIANEGGLRREDFGHIDIRGDHSLVELPAELSAQTVEALSRTRISGKLIDLSGPDAAAPSGPPAHQKKPRTKKPPRD